MRHGNLLIGALLATLEGCSGSSPGHDASETGGTKAAGIGGASVSGGQDSGGFSAEMGGWGGTFAGGATATSGNGGTVNTTIATAAGGVANAGAAATGGNGGNGGNGGGTASSVGGATATNGNGGSVNTAAGATATGTNGGVANTGGTGGNGGTPSSAAGATATGGFGGTTNTAGTAGTSSVPDNCIKSGWCWENPVPGGGILRSVWATAPNDVWAVGNAGLILHFDGVRWRRAATPSQKTWDSVWASGPSDVWIAGADGVHQWNGTTWVQRLTGDAVDIHGSGPNNVRVTTGYENISYFDGSVMRTPAGTSGFDDMIWSVWTFEPYVVFGAGTWGNIIRGDGNAAPSYGPTLLYRSGVAGTLNDLWGTTKDDYLWAVGDGGQALKGIGSNWVDSNPGTPQPLNGVWGSSQQDIWAVGDLGTILHYDGFVWSDQSIDTRSDFYDVSGTGPNDVWIVGSDGLILHNTGNGWTTPNALTTSELKGVFGTSDNDIWAVGYNGTALHRDATGWHPVASNLTTDFTAIWGSSPNDYWVAASNGHLYHLDGKTFEDRYTAYIQTVLWGTSKDDVWATGSGQVNHYDGSNWSIVTRPFTSTGDVWTDSPNDLWIALGGDGYWRRLNGTWTQATTPGLARIWGASESEIYGCYDYPVISFQRWNGTKWTSSGGGTRCSNPRDMHGNAGNNVWVAAAAGQTYHWDGTTFTAVTSMGTNELDADLNGVWVSPTGRVYMVGTAGTIIVYDSGKP